MVRVGSTIMSGVTKVQLGAKSAVLPGDAKALKQIHTLHAAAGMTTIQSLSIKYEIESSDLKNVTPYEVLGAPTGAGLVASTAIPSPFTGMEHYDVEVECRGSDQVNVYGTSLVDATIEPEALAYLFVDTNMPAMQQRHAKMGTMTTITGADADVAGTKYTFSGGSRIVELFGAVHFKTLASLDALLGGIKYTSSEFMSSLPQELPIYPFTAGVTTTNIVAHIPGVSRLKGVDIPLKPGQVAIQDYGNFNLTPATADSAFIDGVIYV